MKLSIVLVAYGLLVVNALQENDSCTTPCHKPGQCVPWDSCKYFKNRIRKIGFIGSYFKESNCGVASGPETLTCCPRLLNPEGCGVVNTKKPNIKGDPVQHVFPWNGLLVYSTIDENVLVPTCAATLITSRFMVTAARCISYTQQKWRLQSVQFEWNREEQNCEAVLNNFCYMRYDIDKFYIHPMFSKTSAYDIAVLKLSGAVSFSEHVRPICLPLDETIRQFSSDGDNYAVAGWPQTMSVGSIKRFNSYTTDTGQIWSSSPYVCRECDNASCNVGSGGALLREVDSIWYQIGIVGFETNVCERAKHELESHTIVANYLSWIEDVVNESQCDW